jgi:hypothetical protein
MSTLLPPTALVTYLDTDLRTRAFSEWPVDTLSDHLPQYYVSKTGVKVVTWNILNQRWMHYILARDPADNRVESKYFSDDEDVVADRTVKIVHRIGELFLQGHIVCLQEVSDAVLALIRDMLDKCRPAVTFNVHVSGEGTDNQTATVFDTSIYTMVTQRLLLPKSDRHEEITYAVMQRMGADDVRFNLANVHVNWRTNTSLIEACKREFLQGSVFPTIVCGDFNTASRLPPHGDGDRLEAYDALPGALFAVPRMPGFSHANLLKNAGDLTRQLDLCDNFLILNTHHDF